MRITSARDSIDFEADRESVTREPTPQLTVRQTVVGGGRSSCTRAALGACGFAGDLHELRRVAARAPAGQSNAVAKEDPRATDRSLFGRSRNGCMAAPLSLCSMALLNGGALLTPHSMRTLATSELRTGATSSS